MKKEIDFTIIIPTYNRDKFIYSAIQSVLEQEYKNFELIIVDDGSTDNTKHILQSIKDERIKCIFKINEERAAARNAGIKLASGKYVTFLDSDDRLFVNHLKEAKSFVLNKGNLEIFHLGYQIRNVLTDKTLKVIPKQVTSNQLLIKGNTLSCNGVFIRNDIAKQNLFNETRALSTLEDWELWLRISTQFPIYTHSVITSEILNHENRSVLLEDKVNLINKFDVFMNIVLNNQKIVKFYHQDLKKFKSSCYTYISLHIALTKKNKVDSLKYLMRGVFNSPNCIFSRRFLAIIKHLIF